MERASSVEVEELLEELLIVRVRSCTLLGLLTIVVGTLKLKELSIGTILGGADHLSCTSHHTFIEDLGLGSEIKITNNTVVGDDAVVGFDDSGVVDMSGVAGDGNGSGGGISMSDQGLRVGGGEVQGWNGSLLRGRAALLVCRLAGLINIVRVLALMLSLLLSCQGVPVVLDLLWFVVPGGSDQRCCNQSA